MIVLLKKKSEYNWGIVGLNLIKSGQKKFNSLCKTEKETNILKTVSSNGDAEYRNIKSIIALLDWNLEKEKSETNSNQ